jgi:hypothetical protein
VERLLKKLAGCKFVKTDPGVSTRPILKTGKTYFRVAFAFAHSYPRNKAARERQTFSKDTNRPV